MTVSSSHYQTNGFRDERNASTQISRIQRKAVSCICHRIETSGRPHTLRVAIFVTVSSRLKDHTHFMLPYLSQCRDVWKTTRTSCCHICHSIETSGRPHTLHVAIFVTVSRRLEDHTHFVLPYLSQCRDVWKTTHTLRVPIFVTVSRRLEDHTHFVLPYSHVHRPTEQEARHSHSIKVGFGLERVKAVRLTLRQCVSRVHCIDPGVDLVYWKRRFRL